MKQILIVFLTLIATKTMASNEAICYGREYSADHLKNKANQTVQKIQAKFETEKEFGTRFMHLEVTLKGENNFYTNYRASFIYIPESKTWAIECDGGQAKTSITKSGNLVLENKGFILEGGCGSPEESKTVFLNATPGGDDKFELVKLPKAFCQSN